MSRIERERTMQQAALTVGYIFGMLSGCALILIAQAIR